MKAYKVTRVSSTQKYKSAIACGEWARYYEIGKDVTFRALTPGFAFDSIPAARFFSNRGADMLWEADVDVVESNVKPKFIMNSAFAQNWLAFWNSRAQWGRWSTGEHGWKKWHQFLEVPPLGTIFCTRIRLIEEI